MKHDTRNSSKKLKSKDLKRITDPNGKRVWLMNGQRFYTLAQVPNSKKVNKDDLPKNRFTKKGCKHEHNPTWLPPKANMSPAAWKLARREKRKQNANRTPKQQS